MRKNKILSVIGGLAAFIFTSCDGIFDVDYYTFLPEDYIFTNESTIEEGLLGCYELLYPNSFGGSSWGVRPHMMLANLPTLDVQASGWDFNYCKYEWTASESQFRYSWKCSYAAISRINSLLAGMESVKESVFKEGIKAKNEVIAQARALRAYNYIYLGKNFGRVPMLMTGENYSTSPAKPRPETADEMWKLIIEDLEYATGVLDWQPLNGQYGRITKGMCLAYLAEAYMYNNDYDSAKQRLKQIIDSKTYELLPCFASVHDMGNYWSKESVWEHSFYKFSTMTSSASKLTDALIQMGYRCASMEHAGYGSFCLSWEFYNSFEPGDKRKQYSCVALGENNPYTGEAIGVDPAYNAEVVGTDHNPNVYTLKYWREQHGAMKKDHNYNPCSLTMKRYAGVLLDYAECCFRTNDEATGWEIIKQIRNRAWGNLETGMSGEYVFGFEDLSYVRDDYKLNKVKVEVPDAKSFYTRYKAEKGYTADVWLVALTIERRHEFNIEFELWYDLCRSGMAEQFINCEYPMNEGWTKRDFPFYDYYMLFPIPTDEILNNDLINEEDQNPGY